MKKFSILTLIIFISCGSESATTVQDTMTTTEAQDSTTSTPEDTTTTTVPETTTATVQDTTLQLKNQHPQMKCQKLIILISHFRLI